jgi:hypothetical protein
MQERFLKPQIYKVGVNWILWVPGVRVYRFASWQSAMEFALEQASRQPAANTATARAAGTR